MRRRARARWRRSRRVGGGSRASRLAPRMVGGSPTGCTEALLYGISADVLVEPINIGFRSWDRSRCRAIVDAMVRRTDAGRDRDRRLAAARLHDAHPAAA